MRAAYSPNPQGARRRPRWSRCVPWLGRLPCPRDATSPKVGIVAGLSGLTQAPNRVVVQLRSPKNPPPLALCADRPGAALPSVTVPNVDGMTSLAAASVLAKVCLNAGYDSPVGSWVISETPAAGSTVAEHSTVSLTTR